MQNFSKRINFKRNNFAARFILESNASVVIVDNSFIKYFQRDAIIQMMMASVN